LRLFSGLCAKGSCCSTRSFASILSIVPGRIVVLGLAYVYHVALVHFVQSGLPSSFRSTPVHSRFPPMVVDDAPLRRVFRFRLILTLSDEYLSLPFVGSVKLASNMVTLPHAPRFLRRHHLFPPRFPPSSVALAALRPGGVSPCFPSRIGWV
jgi:hypothetical protein